MERITNCCMGCKMCEKVCPKKAIRFEDDKEGFWQPLINQKICIDCGLCEQKCPVNCDNLGLLVRDGHFLNDFPKCFGVWAKNLRDVQISSSGGVFSVFARNILKHDGLVFGATYSSDLKSVYHESIDRLEDLDDLRRSKYVQSDVRGTFVEVKEALKNDREVLYVGVTCQIAALRSFLGKKANDKNLLLIDVICHGVPSPKVFRKYIEYISDALEEKVEEFNFRYKPESWSGLLYSKVISKTKIRLKNSNEDFYFQWFLRDYILRESCYHCRFVGKKRISDITIGDFWGVEKNHPDKANHWGVSAVICNTAHGLSRFNEVKDKVEYFETSWEKISEYNPVLMYSVKRPEFRDHAFKDLREKGIEQLIKEFEDPSIKLNRLKRTILFIKRIVLTQRYKLRFKTRIKKFLKG